MAKHIDFRGGKYDFERTGNLYVRQDPDQTFTPKFAKQLDVGLDLPVKINIDEIKFANAGENPDRLRSCILYPDLRHYIYPDGSKDDPHPFLEVPAHGWAEIPTGLRIKLPDDAWGFLKSRSSTNWKMHLIIDGSTIDPGYTGQLGVLVYNPNSYPVRVHEYDPKTGLGDRVAQLILVPVYDLKSIVLVDELPETSRGITGFGSSTNHVRTS